MSSQPNILDIAEPMQVDEEVVQVGQARDPEAEQSVLRTCLYSYFPD